VNELGAGEGSGVNTGKHTTKAEEKVAHVITKLLKKMGCVPRHKKVGTVKRSRGLKKRGVKAETLEKNRNKKGLARNGPRGSRRLAGSPYRGGSELGNLHSKRVEV